MSVFKGKAFHEEIRDKMSVKYEKFVEYSLQDTYNMECIKLCINDVND